MGPADSTENGRVNPGVNEERATAGTTAGTGGRGRSNKGTNSTDASTGGSGGSGGNGRGTSATAKEKEPTRLAILSPEEQAKRDKRNARRRELRAERKAEAEANGGVPNNKPRKVNKNKQQEPAIDRGQINQAIVGLFGIIASRPNCGQWAITEEEADSITAPLSRMLKDSELFNQVAEHSDHIALGMACISVFVPRALVSYTIYKEEKERERKVKQLEQQKRQANSRSVEHDREESTPAKGPSNVNTWYGLPVA